MSTTASRVWIRHEDHRSGGEPDDPEDQWTSHSDVEIELTILGIQTTEPSSTFFNDSVEVEPEILDLKKVYLVVVRYRDGDTFGSSSGNYKFYSIRATAAEANADQKAIEADRDPKGPYLEWDGYFCGLESVDIHLMDLER